MVLSTFLNNWVPVEWETLLFTVTKRDRATVIHYLKQLFLYSTQFEGLILMALLGLIA